MKVTLEYLMGYSYLCQKLNFKVKPSIEMLNSFFLNEPMPIKGADSVLKIQKAIDEKLIHLLKLEEEIEFDIILRGLGSQELFPICYAIKDKLTPTQFWNMVGLSYVGGGLSRYSLIELIQIFNEPIPCRENMMSEEDLITFKNLPQTIQIYRGCSKTESLSNQHRISWSLDRNVAEKFALRTTEIYHVESVVLEKTISKANAIAYFNNRQEEEIIFLG